MVKVTRIDGRDIVINAELIQRLESTPDTVLTLVNGRKILLKDSVRAIVEKIIAYKRLIHNPELEITDY